MTSTTSIGDDDPRSKESGIDDEAGTPEGRKPGSPAADEKKGDLTREDIERGNDRNSSADEMGRSGRTNRLPDPGIRISDG